MMMWRIDLYDSCSMMQNIAEGFGFLLRFELTDEVSTARVGRFRNRSIQA